MPDTAPFAALAAARRPGPARSPPRPAEFPSSQAERQAPQAAPTARETSWLPSVAGPAGVALEPQVGQVLVANKGRVQGILGLVVLDDVFGDLVRVVGPEDVREVDRSGARVGETAVGRAVLDVILADAGEVVPIDPHRVGAAGDGPVEVDLQVHIAAGGAGGDHVVGADAVDGG